MRKHILTALALLTAASPVAAAERQFTITDFDKIQVDGPYQVNLVTGRASSARASGDRDAIDALDVDVQGQTLRIRRSQSAWGNAAKQKGPVTIALTTQALRSVSVNGAGKFATAKVKGMRLDIAMIGSGEIAMAGIESDVLNVTLMGAGRVSLAGKAKSMRGDIHGSGNLEADGLTAGDALLFADTAGTIRLAAARSAKVTSSAAGDIEILGSPACTVKSTGTGSVHCGRN